MLSENQAFGTWVLIYSINMNTYTFQHGNFFCLIEICLLAKYSTWSMRWNFFFLIYLYLYTVQIIYNSYDDRQSSIPQLWVYMDAFKVKVLSEDKTDDSEQNNYSSCTAHNEVVVVTQ